MDHDRLNSPNTSAVTLEALGHHLHFSQDPNSKHLGTTVWEASMVFIKFLERNCRKGRFCPSKLKGKRAIELGAGCGLAGFGMALLGCDVVSTDQVEVLPLLMRNLERNMSRIMQADTDSASFGSIHVAELDWGNQEHVKAVSPPFDYIIGTDIVYAEHLLEPLLQTIMALSGPRTTILMCYEIRSTAVHKQVICMWNSKFEVKTVSRSKMDSKYQHPSIQLYVMSIKPQHGFEESASNAYEIPESKNESDENGEASGLREWECGREFEKLLNEEQVSEMQNKKLDDQGVRRCGSMAARLLKDVKITQDRR
uniref:Methyltransferase-like protein 21D n=1 Tax=Anthurium amnicola TaxID=1678845 RepID=A0A1D1Y8X0_9ARAE